MIIRKDLLAMAFYERSPFTGSYGNMRYRVEKVMIKEESESENSEDIKEEKKLQATIWPGPYCFDKTEEDVKVKHLEEFSEEGMEAVVEWLNDKYTEIYT